MNVNEWLNQPVPASEISTNADGSQYIQISIVEDLLTELSNGKWSTKNFKWNFLQQSTTLFISASVELEIHIPEQGVRVLTGATTFTDFEYQGNQDYIATALSEAIKNAAKRIGKRFGKDLNGRSERRNGTESKKAILMKPDSAIMKQYMKAIEANDKFTIERLTSMYEIKVG